MMDDSLYLRTTRERLRWFQEQMGQHLGVSVASVTAWETGRTRVPISVIRWLKVVNLALDSYQMSSGYWIPKFITRDEQTGQILTINREPSEIIFNDGVEALLWLLLYNRPPASHG